MVTNIEKFQKRKEASEKIDKIIIIISILMLAIIPNVMYRKDVTSYSPIITGHPYATGSQVDVFNYYKSVLVNISAFFMLILFSYKTIVLKQDIKKHILNIVVPILGFIILLSSIMSDYKSIAFFGNHDRFEGSLAWFSYLVIFFVLFNTKIDEKYYKFYYIALIPFIIINSVFSISYLYGHNLLVEQEWLNNMLGGGLSGYIITTLYNPNFGSGISAVVFSISLMYLLLEKNIKVKILLLLSTVFSFAMLIAMASSGGFVTILITIPFILVIAVRMRGIKNFSIWGSLVFILSFLVYTIFSKANEKVYNESFSIIDKINSVSNLIIPVCITVFILAVLFMKFINRKKFFDIFLGVILVSFLVGFFSISSLVRNNIGEIKSNSIYQKINEISTDRINIWLKTINLMNGDLFLGNGLDTLPYEMVKNDEDEGISTYGEFIDKPHNWYLTISYGLGVIGLLSILLLLGFVFRNIFFNLSDKNDSKYVYIFGIGVMSYAIQGLSNDSFSGTSIIFWIICSIVCSSFINRKKNAS